LKNSADSHKPNQNRLISSRNIVDGEYRSKIPG